MEEFDKDFYLATLRTARMAGMSVIPQWECALLMAILTVFGNNESFTHSPKFLCDCVFIKETYHIDGGETPDEEFAYLLRTYIARCDAVKDDSDEFFQECAKLIKERYNFRLFV